MLTKENVFDSVKIIAIFSFAASIVYDLGFYFSLGIDILVIPTSITDHLYNSIGWLPFVTIFFLIGTVVAIPSALENIDYDNKTPEIQEKIMKENKWFSRILIIMIVLTILTFIKFGEVLTILLAMAIIIIFMFILEHIKNVYDISQKVYITLIYSTLIGILFFEKGYDEGYKARHITEHKNIIYYNDKSVEKNISIIRSLDTGYLINSNSNIKFINNKNVEKIEYINLPTYYEGIDFEEIKEKLGFTSS